MVSPRAASPMWCTCVGHLASPAPNITPLFTRVHPQEAIIAEGNAKKPKWGLMRSFKGGKVIPGLCLVLTCLFGVSFCAHPFRTSDAPSPSVCLYGPTVRTHCVFVCLYGPTVCVAYAAKLHLPQWVRTLKLGLTWWCVAYTCADPVLTRCQPGPDLVLTCRCVVCVSVRCCEGRWKAQEGHGP